MAQTPNKVKKKLNFYAKLPPKVSNDTKLLPLDKHRAFQVKSAFFIVAYATNI